MRAGPAPGAPEFMGRRSEAAAGDVAEVAAAEAAAVKSIDLLDPTSEVSRFEEKVRREEARVRGQQEIAASSLDAQFESLEDLGEKTEVEARLAALKAGGAGQAALTSGDVDADETLTLDYAAEGTAEETGTARG